MQLPDVVRSYIAAYNAKDVDAMLACLSEDVRFRNISDGKVTAETSDKSGFAELAQVGVTAFSRREQVVRNAISVDDLTLVQIDYSAIVAADLPNGWKAGERLAFQGASAFRVNGGKIVGITDES